MKTILRLAVIMFLVISIVAVGRSVYNQLSKFKEINQAEGQVQKLSQEQADLQSGLGKGSSPSFVESQARDKLGYQRPGETLYVVDLNEAERQQKEQKNKENWQAWVDLLFR